MPARLMAAIPALPALLLGFFLMQTGNTFQGTILQHPRRDRGLHARADRRGRSRFLGRRHHRIATRRCHDTARRTHSDLRNLRSDRRRRAARASSCGGSVRVDSGASADWVLLRRHVHRDRELAERRRKLREQGTSPEHLRDDRVAGRHKRAASPAYDRSSGLQAVLHHRVHHFACACADRLDPGRGAGAARRKQPCRPEPALPRLASQELRPDSWVA